LLAPIFRSEGQARLLAVLLLGDVELSISDVAERAHLAYPTAHREAARLLDAGILEEQKVGRVRLLRSNPQSPLTAPLREILLVSTGPVVLLAEDLAAIPGIEAAFLYGSFAARMAGQEGPAPHDIDLMVIPGIEAAFLYGSFAARMAGQEGPAPHDIDLMVIGSPDAAQIYAACARVGEMVHRPVNPTVMSWDEFHAESGFLSEVRSSPAIPVIGGLPW